MGKIRVKTFDEAENEALEAKKKAKREAKKTQKALDKASKPEVAEKAKTATAPEEKTAVAHDTITTPEVIKAVETKEATAPAQNGTKRTKKEKFIKEKALSKRFSENKKMVSKNQTYPLDKAVSLLAQFKTGRFDESVELHVNVREQGTSGTLTLPHGSGKTLRIKIADDAIISDITNGKIDFDVLVATPDMMPKLAKVAKILGPRGLMPNPKNGTVTNNPDEAVKKLSGGEMRFKTESKAPVIHLLIGKVSFGENKIKENAKTALDTIGTNKIKSATLSSTMSPGIKLSLASL